MDEGGLCYKYICSTQCYTLSLKVALEQISHCINISCRLFIKKISCRLFIKKISCRLIILRRKRCEEDRWVLLANIGESLFFLQMIVQCTYWIYSLIIMINICKITTFTFSGFGENFPCPEQYGMGRRQAIASKRSQDR